MKQSIFYPILIRNYSHVHILFILKFKDWSFEELCGVCAIMKVRSLMSKYYENKFVFSTKLFLASTNN